MTTQKIPIKVNVDGVKKTIGWGVIDTSEGYIDMSGTITDPEWRRKLSQGVSFSIGHSLDGPEVSIVPKDEPVRFRATHPLPLFTYGGNSGPTNGPVHHAARDQHRKGR